MNRYLLTLFPTTDEASAYYSDRELDGENAGFDLFVPEETVFAPGERKLVSMRVRARMEIKYPGWADWTQCHYWMAPRSSISKTGLVLLNSMGVIDKGYRGELMAFLWNTLDKEVTVKKGDRLVQLLAPDMGYIYSLHVRGEVDTTTRGTGGFGSTGR